MRIHSTGGKRHAGDAGGGIVPRTSAAGDERRADYCRAVKGQPCEERKGFAMRGQEHLKHVQCASLAVRVNKP